MLLQIELHLSGLGCSRGTRETPCLIIRHFLVCPGHQYPRYKPSRLGRGKVSATNECSVWINCDKRKYISISFI